MSFTYTNEQAAKIVAKWNELTNESYQISADKAHTLFHDNSDDEMDMQGYTTIEVGRFASKTGNPVTFEIDDTEVCMDEGE